MHDTAWNNAIYFYTKYCLPEIETKTILDIGSLDVNGTMKPIFQSAYKYIGLDQCKGRNVNMISSSHNIDLAESSIDIIISSSCFEHDNMFWLTFKEMCRLIKSGGFIYINAPSNGPHHAYPVDNWRFYADSWRALKTWGIHLGYNIELVESYIDKQTSSCGNWNDSVGIFTKQ